MLEGQGKKVWEKEMGQKKNEEVDMDLWKENQAVMEDKDNY